MLAKPRQKPQKVKTDREEGSALTVQELKFERRRPTCKIPSSLAVDHKAEVRFFNAYDETAKLGSEIYTCDMKTLTWTTTKSMMHMHIAPPIGTPAYPNSFLPVFEEVWLFTQVQDVWYNSKFFAVLGSKAYLFGWTDAKWDIFIQISQKTIPC
ncbi:hypothetical protein C8F04DRAFT_1186628 [Mycena alexandri]|uniref:Uncharacterized protein n=1 Tax=Mycena alexandri TaxID=1745969 RepID=A0AAD6WX13_9AGAR|nr:hypothetical protein C8F04DRAFT_1186628 [Mycena alexandri]